jgi:hypothetical protein
MTQTLCASFVLMVTAQGCNNANEHLKTVQRAVGTAAQASLSARVVVQPVVGAERVPSVTRATDGRLHFVEDDTHRVPPLRGSMGHTLRCT